jgi:hypothetical protein
LTEWTVSGPEGGIAITPVANTEYHPLLEGGGATGCGIDTKVELRKISENYNFLIDQWHCINSLQINKQTDDSTLLDIQIRLSDKKKREIMIL